MLLFYPYLDTTSRGLFYKTELQQKNSRFQNLQRIFSRNPQTTVETKPKTLKETLLRNLQLQEAANIISKPINRNT